MAIKKMETIKFPNSEDVYEVTDKNAVHSPQDNTKIGLFREFEGKPQYSMDGGLTWKDIGGGEDLSFDSPGFFVETIVTDTSKQIQVLTVTEGFIDWGDGVSENLVFDERAGGYTTLHKYKKCGIYYIKCVTLPPVSPLKEWDMCYLHYISETGPTATSNSLKFIYNSMPLDHFNFLVPRGMTTDELHIEFPLRYIDYTKLDKKVNSICLENVKEQPILLNVESDIIDNMPFDFVGNRSLIFAKNIKGSAISTSGPSMNRIYNIYIRNMEYMYGNSDIFMADFDFSYTTNTERMFAGCKHLLQCNMTHCNDIQNADRMFEGCVSLTRLDFGDARYNEWNANLNISYCKLLDKESLMSVIHALAKQDTGVVKTLTLGKTLKDKLTAEDIAIATNKGWTIA